MEHLKVNNRCDSVYSIQWIAENIEKCRLDLNYTDQHEPTVWGRSISVRLPSNTDNNLWSEFAANEDGWMYVSDWNASHLPEIPIEYGIKEVECNVLREMKKSKEEDEDG